MTEYSIRKFDVKSKLLNNNMPVYVVPRLGSPTVSVNCFVHTGSIHEDELLGSGVSHFLEHMLFNGSKKFPGHQVAELINGMGGDINAGTGFNQTRYICEIPADKVRLGCEIIADMVSAPNLDEEDFNAEKEVILRECALCNDSYAWRGYLGLINQIFPSHPCGIPIIGYDLRLRNLSGEELRNFYRRRYAPEKMFFVVGGDVDAEEVFDCLEEFIGSWSHGVMKEDVIFESNPTLGGGITESIFADDVSRLFCGFKVCDCFDDDYYALTLLAAILGQNRSSVLVKKLKRADALALDISCQMFNLPGVDIFEILASCEHDKVLELEAAIKDEFAKVCRTRYSNELVEKEKERLYLNYMHEFASLRNSIGSVASGIMLNKNPNLSAEILEKIMQVTPEDIQRAAQKYLRTELLHISRVVPEALLEQSEPPKRDNMRIETISGGICRRYFVNDPELPFVDFFMVLPGGTLFEDESSFGSTQLLCRLLCGGFEGMNEEMIADFIDENCLSFNANCSSGHIFLSLNMPKDNLSAGVKLLQGIFSSLKIDPAVFERERNILATQSSSRLMNPLQAAFSEMRRIYYPEGCALAHDPAGVPEEFAGLTIEKVMECYQRIFDSTRCYAGVSGDIDRAGAVQMMNDLFSVIKWSNPLHDPEDFGEFNHGAISEITLPREQAVAVMGLPGFELSSPDKLVFDVLRYAVDGFNSKLFKSVREENSLAYSTGVSFNGSYRRGVTIFYAMVACENIDRALELFKREIERLAGSGIDEDELAQGVAGAIFANRQILEYGSSYLGDYMLSEYYHSCEPDAAKRIERFNTMTLEEVNLLLRRYFSKSAPAVVKVKCNM